jgi:hypothetical protein
MHFKFSNYTIMKKILAIVLFIAMGLTSFAQDNENEIKTLFGHDRSNGGYGAFSIGYTQVQGINSLTMGGRGAWIVGHSLALGFTGSGFVSDFTDMDASTSYNFVGGYGGLLVEPIIIPKSPVHLSFPITLGIGGIAYARTDRTGSTNQWDSYIEDNNVFLVAEPGAELELNLTRFLRLAFGAYYRVTSDISLRSAAPDALNGFSGAITFKFGKF